MRRTCLFVPTLRMLDSVKASRVWVDVCDDVNDKCEPEKALLTNVDGKQRVKIKSSQDEVQIINALRDYKSTKILSFSTMLNVFGGHRNQSTHEQFMRRTENYMSLWCCTKENDVPGHIWYDMWADVIPHVDRHMRGWNNAWTTKFGP